MKNAVGKIIILVIVLAVGYWIVSGIFSRWRVETEKQKAHTPTPPNTPGGYIHRGTWIKLSWKPGCKAVSHDVYMGENFDDVNEGTGDTFRGNTNNVFYVAGFHGYAYPNGLVSGTTYYWRIDEINEADSNSPWKGDIWSFTVKDGT